MKILIEVIPHSQQRYPTAGDWYWDDPEASVAENTLNIKVSDTYDWRESVLIAIHELVEAFGCKARDIPQSAVDEWDKNFSGEGEEGDDPKAPYHSEHTFATAIERLVAELFYVNWANYGENIERLLNPPPPLTPSASDDDIPF
jgi:hypothetical protein